jgi:hypothetical protein
MRQERGLGAGNNVNGELSALRRRGTRLQVPVQQLLSACETFHCREPQPHQQSESDEAAALTNSSPFTLSPMQSNEIQVAIWQ